MARLALLFWLGPISVFAYSNGPPPDHVRIPWPAEALRSCTLCHSGVVNSFPGNLTLRAPAVREYQPGTNIPLGIDVIDSSPRMRWGFQLAAVTAALAQAGSLTPLDSTTGVVFDPTRMVDFIRQSLIGSVLSSWDFEWTAPAAGSGDVTLYFCANAADGNGDATNDHIFCSSAIFTEARCDPRPLPITRVEVVRRGADLEWSWTPDPDAAGGYRLYGVAASSQIANANQSTPGARRVCPAPNANDAGCSEPTVANDGVDVYYQIVGVCANGEEGPN